ncbi:FAD/NAD(P)-binding domain-containing protein [Periconia macrospinosa]|uniref:FAD/NAD(P)-binding domain-containing protein n=1 Tax=Periconia macrospinosa TaxID=97972 RepID=A0A2V1DFH9_9PLEO|nr:FAD/NAD(P)-binding domain-containing protein [Periconia macrospinosa]
MALDLPAPADRPLDVVVVGGSLAGLMSGIALKHAGHNVRILEQDNNERESHMAGVCLGRDAHDFLAKHDLVDEPFSHQSNQVQVLKQDGKAHAFYNVRRDITSWDALYFRLRANFDAYPSTYYPDPPKPDSNSGHGTATYQPRTRVLHVARGSGNGDIKPILTIQERETMTITTLTPDLIVAADGPNSTIRTTYFPRSLRQYAGYIAWRGTVLESNVSTETRALFDANVTVTMMSQHHCIMYSIPGETGTLAPGQRLLNFLWYTNETPSDLAAIMTDALDDTHVHRHLVPAGRVRADIWATQVRKAERIPLAAPFLEVLRAIRRPFIQVITDFCADQAVFEDGRILLVGDAVSLYRPHTAFSCTQAAFHALSLEQYINGQLSLERWNERVLRYGRLLWLQSAWWGDFYQRPMLLALGAMAKYWMYSAWDRLVAWWHGEERLLRY